MLYLALLAAAAIPASPAPGTNAPVMPAASAPVATQPAGEGPEPLPSPPRGISVPSFVTAGELQAKCQDRALAMVSYCYAYVTGVHDSVKAYETWLNMREFCRPLRMSQSELRQAFVEYMNRNPAAATGEAASVVVVALRQKYACDAPAPRDPLPGAP